MAFSVIWRRRGYGGVSNLIYGGCVSRSLSSVSTTDRMSPWLMLPPAKEGEDVVYKFFSLAENRVLSFNWSVDPNRSDFGPNDDLAKLVGHSPAGYDPDDEDADLVGSTNGWLGLFNTLNNRTALINPLTRRYIKLPSVGYACNWSASQMIISCSPDDEEEEEGECRALISYGANQLGFCCPGRSPRWTQIGDHDNYESFVYSKRQKLFFCTRRSSEELAYLEAWDLRDPLYPKPTLNDVKLTLNDPNPSLFERGSRHRYQKRSTRYFLVVNEDTDDLFVVRRFVWVGLAYDSRYNKDDFPYKSIAFDVHGYVPESGTLRYMDGGSLDGLSFFIGSNNGFALSAAEFPELKPNSIYFTDVWSPPRRAWSYYNHKFGGHDIGIYNYEDATISPCYYPCDVPSFKMLSPHPRWFTPNTTTKAN